MGLFGVLKAPVKAVNKVVSKAPGMNKLGGAVAKAPGMGAMGKMMGIGPSPQVAPKPMNQGMGQIGAMNQPQPMNQPQLMPDNQSGAGPAQATPDSQYSAMKPDVIGGGPAMAQASPDMYGGATPPMNLEAQGIGPSPQVAPPPPQFGQRGFANRPKMMGRRPGMM